MNDSLTPGHIAELTIAVTADGQLTWRIPPSPEAHQALCHHGADIVALTGMLIDRVRDDLHEAQP